MENKTARPSIVILAAQVALCVPVLFLTKSFALIYTALLLLLMICTFIRFVYYEINDSMTRSVVGVLIFTSSTTFFVIFLFGNLYRWIGLVFGDHEKTGGDLWQYVYFSCITWTTVGYGDISPSYNARFTAAIEALTGYVMMSLVIAMLVTIIQAKQNRKNSDLIERIANKFLDEAP